MNRLLRVNKVSLYKASRNKQIPPVLKNYDSPFREMKDHPALYSTILKGHVPL